MLHPDLTMADLFKLTPSDMLERGDPDHEAFCLEFDLSGLNWFQDDRWQAFWLYRTLDSDTHIGIMLYFLDEVMVCKSRQSGRKSDMYITWVSEEAYLLVKKFYMTKIPVTNDYRSIPVLDPRESVMHDFLSHRGQVVNRQVEYQGGPVDILPETFDMRTMPTVRTDLGKILELKKCKPIILIRDNYEIR